MQFITVLAGSQFRPAETKDVLRELPQGTRLRLERDPENQFDMNAIKVIYDEPVTVVDGDLEETSEIISHFLGFVAKTDNPVLAAILDGKLTYEETPVLAEGHTPEVTRCEIIDFVSGGLKPTIVIEVSDGFEISTEVEETSAENEDEFGDDDEE